MNIEKHLEQSLGKYINNGVDSRKEIEKVLNQYFLELLSQDNFHIVCDLTNNTEETISRGEMVVDIYLNEAVNLPSKWWDGMDGMPKEEKKVDYMQAVRDIVGGR